MAFGMLGRRVSSPKLSALILKEDYICSLARQVWTRRAVERFAVEQTGQIDERSKAQPTEAGAEGFRFGPKAPFAVRPHPHAKGGGTRDGDIQIRRLFIPDMYELRPIPWEREPRAGGRLCIGHGPMFFPCCPGPAP